MRAVKINVKTLVGDDRFDCELFDAGGGRKPGVVMIPEIFGINEALRETAARYAAEGFCVLAMDIFWCLERNVELGFGKDDFDRARSLHAAFDYSSGVEDMQQAISALRNRPECNGRVGVVGFCLGGTMAYLAGSRTDADAAVAYYGTRIDKFLDDGPKIRWPTILHIGRRDHRTPPPILASIEHAISGNPHVQAFVYDEAKHAFANHRRPDTYDERAAKLADARTFAFFREKLC